MTINSKEEALGVARAKVLDVHARMELAIQEDKTVEREFGWVFFVTTKEYLRTKSHNDLLPGIGPLVVDRDTGLAQFLSTSVMPQRAIDEYARRWRENKK